MNLTHLMDQVIVLLTDRRDRGGTFDVYTSKHVAAIFRAAPTLWKWTKWRRIKWLRRARLQIQRNSRMAAPPVMGIRDMLDRLS